jgi:hypothetical protein
MAKEGVWQTSVSSKGFATPKKERILLKETAFFAKMGKIQINEY